jgi:hypothetical protein
MEFILKLNIEQINTILRGLDMRPHGEVRQVLDYIINEVNQQQAPAAAPSAEAEEIPRH